MAGSGVVSRAQKPGKGERQGRHSQEAAWLPLDVIVEIAARSDPATLVRCAATCRDARRRIAEDPSLLGRLRLRDTDRFVLPLLRGHLTGITTDDEEDYDEKINVYMVDTTGAADATRLVKHSFTKAGETLREVSMDSRGGLVLVCATTTTQDSMYHEQKLVCSLATRRFHILPPEPAFPGDDDDDMSGVQYVLLVGVNDDEGTDAAVGRPFKVLKVKLELSENRSYRRLLVHTFSSEHGAWSPLTEIPTPDLHGRRDYRWKSVLHGMPLVVGDVVHWLCLTDSGSYMLMLQVGVAQVNLMSLPASFPRDDKVDSFNERYQYLIATATADGNPIVLVADNNKVSAWELSKHTKMWKSRPQVVIDNKTILGFKDDGLAKLVEQESRWGEWKPVPELLWFGERSGAVLLRIDESCLLWLDLQSKKIVRCFSNDRIDGAQVYCPYEVDLSSWVPKFSSAIIL